MKQQQPKHIFEWRRNTEAHVFICLCVFIIFLEVKAEKHLSLCSVNAAFNIAFNSPFHFVSFEALSLKYQKPLMDFEGLTGWASSEFV